MSRLSPKAGTDLTNAAAGGCVSGSVSPIDPSCAASSRSSSRRLTSGILVAVAAALALAGCASTPPKKRSSEYFPESKYGVKASPRVVADGQAVPKGGGRDITGKPYKVAGRWYHPKEDPNYKKTGFASWYGEAFHGRKTANGEIYDRNALTAAHTTMPLPSYARVTNVANGRSMIVRVNDRGPFHGNREIDLSQRVAKMLGTKAAGVAKVKVEYVGRAPLHGRDEAFLMASYSGPDAVTPGGTMPGTMIAQATPPPATAAPAASAVAAPVMMASAADTLGAAASTGGIRAPSPRPFLMMATLTVASTSGSTPVSNPAYQVAFDPAAAFEAGAASVMVASASTVTTSGQFQPVAAPASLPAAPAATLPTGGVQPVSYGSTPAAAPAIGTPPQSLGTLPVRLPAQGLSQPAAYAPQPVSSPFDGLQPAGNGPRNLLLGGAISSYAANTRISGAHSAFSAFEATSVPLSSLNR
ncbi:septal ring lytic transglycosylase RlpA family protein [Pannonibacter carbonis]|uniref:septal ring lytic transglycosylase RlpA family protein n=1 Tax=Pannonibacter carbonis TaxID=2067569 RepID=UPI003CC5A5BA